MAVKLSDLTTESTPASTDILAIADPTTGLMKKITVSALKTYMDGLGGGADATAPIVVTATATGSSTVVVVFSESVTVTTSGWSFKQNGSAWAASSVTGSGSTWTFSMATGAVGSDTLLYSYSSAAGVTVDTAANELANITDASITNSISGTAPTVSSRTVENAAKDDIVVVFSQSMTAVTTAGWSAKKNGVAWTVSSVSGSGTTWTFDMATDAANGDTLLISYDATTGATIGTSLELGSFTDAAVTNNVAALSWTDVTTWASLDGVSVSGGNDLLQSASNGSAYNALRVLAAGNGTARYTYRDPVVPASQGYAIGFDRTAAIEYFNTDYDHCAYAQNGLVSMYKEGVVIGTTHAIADGEIVRLDITGGSVTLQRSVDGTSWTTLETTAAIAAQSTDNLYLKASIAGSSGPNTMDDIKHNGLS